MNRTSPAARTRLFGCAAALLLSLSVGIAQAQSSDGEEYDPPDRAVRLSHIEGDVSLQPAGEEEWGTAVVNRPLTTGDKLWTEDNARVEMYVGPAAVRLSGDTGFSFLNVDDDTIQMRLTAGVMDVRVRDLDENDHIEIDTPNIALSVLRPGKYRVEVNDEGDTTVVKVSEGEVEASGGSQNVVVHAQQAATFTGTQQVSSRFVSLGAPDAFDSWSLERDRRDMVAERSQSSQYVSPEVVGYQDLDDNGTWSSEPEYGYVWTPTRVAMGWSPYRYGRWVWVRPWGWTWIDDAPWGYAPFHYGRWAHVRDRWCWVPGPRHVRPVYAPALVGWVGGPGVDVSLSVGGGGGVAWFPLGPREVYVPAHRVSRRYVERVNVSNTVIVNNTTIARVYENRVTNIDYRNRRVPGGVTAVSRTTFTSAQPVGRHVVRVDEREFTRYRSSGVAPQIRPERAAIVGSPRAGGNLRVPPATVVDRPVVVKREPPRGVSQIRNERYEAVQRAQRDADRQRDAGRQREADRQRDVRQDSDRLREDMNRAREAQEIRQRQEQVNRERQARVERDRQARDTQVNADRQQRMAEMRASRERQQSMDRERQQAQQARDRDRQQAQMDRMRQAQETQRARAEQQQRDRASRQPPPSQDATSRGRHRPAEVQDR